MIICHKKKFIFFKPIKTAGSSVEAALSQFCDESDVITGSLILSEIDDERYDLSPRNNWRKSRVISGDEARDYLERHGRSDLWSTGYKRFKIVDDIIYDEHTSPAMLESTGFDTSGYKGISMVRNPYALLVSYYWWSYHSSFMDSVSYTKDEQQKMIVNQNASLSPNPSDTADKIRYKFENFLNMPVYVKRHTRPCDGDKSVIQWLSAWLNEFFLSSVDYMIRFENIESDFTDVCNMLGHPPPEIPRFKTKIRRSNFPYGDYYTDEAGKLVGELFSDAIKRFRYSL